MSSDSAITKKRSGPKRPAWITFLAVAILFGLTAGAWWAYGDKLALVPLALTLAFIYDLTHHLKSRQVILLSRAIVIGALIGVIVWGLMNLFGKTLIS